MFGYREEANEEEEEEVVAVIQLEEQKEDKEEKNCKTEHCVAPLCLGSIQCNDKH